MKWFITSAFEAEISGSIPGETFAALAQSAERAPFKRVAVGSIPTGGIPFSCLDTVCF